jgi:hypothetical protein
MQERYIRIISLPTLQLQIETSLIHVRRRNKSFKHMVCPVSVFSLITIIFYRTEYHILIFTCVYGDIFFLTNCIVEYKITGWHLVFPMKMKRYIRDMTLTYSLVILQFSFLLFLYVTLGYNKEYEYHPHCICK